MPERFLMCRPSFYRIDYSINPWMNTKNQVIQSIAMQEWRVYVDILRRLGAVVKTIPGQKLLADMVFAANGAYVEDDYAYIAHFKHLQRRGEEKHYASWFKGNRYKIKRMPPGHYFEGAGDLIKTEHGLIGGYGIRTKRKSLEYLRDKNRLNIIDMFSLKDPNLFHLDLCFMPIDSQTCLYYKGAFDYETRKRIKKLFSNAIMINKKDAYSFCCNGLKIGKHLIFCDISAALATIIKGSGYSVHNLDLSEFKKGGGGPHCLALKI